MMSADTTLTCRDCGQSFTFTSGEQDFYAGRGFSEPSRRPDCRAARMAQRDGGSSYDSYRSSSSSSTAPGTKSGADSSVDPIGAALRWLSPQRAVANRASRAPSSRGSWRKGWVV
jgi:Probable zinc-ribbon domain